MSANEIKIDWNEVLPLIGHGIEYSELQSFMFDTLKLDEELKEQDPVDDWSHYLESDAGIELSFNYDSDYEETYVIKQKSEGALVLAGIALYHNDNQHKNYTGELPYKLHFLMTDEEVRNHLKEFFVTNVYREDGKGHGSIFYDSENKVMMTIAYEYSDDIQGMYMVYIYALDLDSVEEYGIDAKLTK